MMIWQRWSRRVQEWREEAREHGENMHWRLFALIVAIAALLVLALSLYWSREPVPFAVSKSVETVLHKSIAQPVPGAVTTATLVDIVSTLLDKPGGFINNDIAPPGVWLDDMPSWERGVLQQARDMMRALRDDFGRSGSEADEDLAHAEPRLNFSDNSWMLPSSESQYRDARNYLRAYLSRLQTGGKPAAYFAATPANLDRYLAQVEGRLDALVQRLSACVTPRENPFLPMDAHDPEPHVATPANRIDDVFYEARGSAWALLHLLRAIDIDFAPVLRNRQAQSALRAVIRDLDATQETIYSPVILNGSGFGLLANHSLVMASYMARADTAVANLRKLLIDTASAPATSTPGPSSSVPNGQEASGADEHATTERETIQP